MANIPIPDFSAAARGNYHLDQALRSIHQRFVLLEQKAGLQGIDTTKRALVTAKPQRCAMSVKGAAGTGRFIVRITNPEFAPIHKGNPQRTHLIHRLQYSPDVTFQSNVTTLDPSPQTYFPIFETPGVTLHFQVSSSYDGANWTSPVPSGSVTA